LLRVEIELIMERLLFTVKVSVAFYAVVLLVSLGSLNAEDSLTRFVTKRVNKGKVENAFGNIVGNALLIKTYPNSWEGGGTDLAFSQTNLKDWNSDEKSFLTFLIFTSMYLSDLDLQGVEIMLGSDAKTVIAKLTSVSDSELADIFGKSDGSGSWKVRRDDYREAIVRFKKYLRMIQGMRREHRLGVKQP